MLLRSYSKRVLHEEHSASSVLLVAELFKLGASLCATADRRPERLLFIFRRSAVALPPVACYLLMNLFQYDAIVHLDVASFAV